ncbi:MAG: succinate dehydrogenase cytochrome b subunit [Bacteroidia bacterium]|nr:succinate dehydrogenase cytochrome b subunit [Bacteroidia bacterium]
MKWITKLFTSSIGKKLVMSLTGIFLILFLIVHLVGNLQLLSNDGGESFNIYAKFMTSNPLIKTVSYGLYLFIVLHTIQGIVLLLQNRSAKKSRYAVKTNQNASWASRNMGPLGIIIFVFIVIHMVQFWFKMKTGALDMVEYAGQDAVNDLYTPVYEAFKNIYFVIFYVVSMLVIAFHLNHGFQSAFQSLGLNHKKYTPFIKSLGKIYSILVPLGFAIIPVWFYFFK